MSKLDKYFNNLLPGTKHYLPGGRVVCLKSLPTDSLDLYFKGFKHISLKEEAVELLEEMCEDDLRYLIELKKGTIDAKIIKKALDAKVSNSQTETTVKKQTGRKKKDDF